MTQTGKQARLTVLKRRFKLRRALFILPNAFTLSSIFCGIYAILNIVGKDDPEALYRSCLAIFFAAFFDMFDGRIARLTKTQSDFGVQLDSLADAVSFGVAPAIIAYKWAFVSLGPIGVLSSAIFTSCGVVRLARFNVLAKRPNTNPNYFIGLPIPIAAGMIIAIVMAHFRLYRGDEVAHPMWVVLSLVALSLLMVSGISFWTFKNVKFGRRTIFFLFSGMIFWFLAIKKYPASLILAGILGCYILLGILRCLYQTLKSPS